MERGGVTWAVLGSGLDETYPAEHGGCALRIVKTGGAVISEFPQSTRPHAASAESAVACAPAAVRMSPVATWISPLKEVS